MKLTIACFSLIVLAASAFAQTERQILVTPNAEHPQAAKDSGLGGRVTVYVTVDPSGNVVSIGDVTGPDSVCPSVTRADVVALRESARTAAPNAKFAAGDMATTIPLNFDFPSEKEGRVYAAAPNPPTDYAGPVSTAPGGRSIPKQISGGVLNGKATSLPKPPYPPAARAVRADGAVSIQVLIIEDGSVFSASPVSGHPLLRSAARQAACGAAFSPTLLMGNPVKVSGVITYNFVP
jgi:outer membrane biosynthesis protein TonB